MIFTNLVITDRVISKDLLLDNPGVPLIDPLL